MTQPRLHELLLVIAEEEDLNRTAERFGISRAAIRQMLREGARRLNSGAAARPGAARQSRKTTEAAEDELPWSRRLDAVDVATGVPSPVAEKPSTASGTVPAKVLVYSDGAARGNPGPAGAGAILMAPDGRVLVRKGKFLGRQTNNVAEYEGVLLGLRTALELGVKEVDVRADSLLLVKQLKGEWKVRNEGLKPLVASARGLLSKFDRYSLRHVPREANAEADEMSNRAIDEKM